MPSFFTVAMEELKFVSYSCVFQPQNKSKADGLTHGSIAGLLKRSVFFEREWFLPINHLTTHVFKIYTGRVRYM